MDIKTLIGLTTEEGKNLSKKNNMKFRIIREDDEIFMVTSDFLIDRVNVEIDNGIIVKSAIG